MGMIPKSTKSDVKIWKGIGLMKFLGIIMTLMISFLIAPLLFSSGALKIFFIVFCVVVFIICTLKSPTDPNKSFIKGLMDFLKFKVRIKDIYGNNGEEYEAYRKECEEREAKKEQRFNKRKERKERKEKA
jgi:uncharacterized protein YacL